MRFNQSTLDLTSSIDEESEFDKISNEKRQRIKQPMKPHNLQLSRTQNNEENEEKRGYDSFSDAMNHALSPTKSSSPKKKKTDTSQKGLSPIPEYLDGATRARKISQTIKKQQDLQDRQLQVAQPEKLSVIQNNLISDLLIKDKDKD